MPPLPALRAARAHRRSTTLALIRLYWLVAHGSPDDGERAAEPQSEALAIYDELGMTSYGAKTEGNGSG